MYPTLEPYFETMRAQGHTIDIVGCGFDSDTAIYDRIIGPQCYRLTPEMLANLPANTLPNIIKEARLEKYGDTPVRGKG